MIKNKIPEGSIKNLIRSLGPMVVGITLAAVLLLKLADPAPPKHFVIATSDGEGDYQTYAKLYKEIIKEDGVDLEIRPSSGTIENLKKLQDPNSGVDAAFVQDGVGTTDEAPDVSSLGSVYYEPLWIFYHGKKELTRFSELLGRRIVVGEAGSGTQQLALRLLKASGIDGANTQLLTMDEDDSVEALKKDQVDAAIFIATPDDEFIKELVHDKDLRLMSVDQAEAISRQVPFLHHLVFPHGAIDLKNNLPEKDVDLVSPTATLLVKDSLHPALSFLLLKAAGQVHSDPGLLEKKNEFPTDKDFQFPLSDEAKSYYKSGTPFWLRYLPFWLATLVDRFILLVIPILALVIPVVKAVPQFLQWRVKNRIYQRYGELKFLETQIKPDVARQKYSEYLRELDQIEDRVNQMQVPLDFSDYAYDLREHIHFVRERLQRFQKESSSASP